MKKSLFVTTATLALAGAMAGLGAFGGMAFAATPGTTTIPSAIVQPTVPAQSPQVKADSAMQSKSISSNKETDNVAYEEQGEHQGNNGVAEASNNAATEKTTEESQNSPDNDNLNVQQ